MMLALWVVEGHLHALTTEGAIHAGVMTLWVIRRKHAAVRAGWECLVGGSSLRRVGLGLEESDLGGYDCIVVTWLFVFVG